MERPGTPEQKAETPSKNRNSASCAVAMGMVVGCRGCDGVFFFPGLFFLGGFNLPSFARPPGKKRAKPVSGVSFLFFSFWLSEFVWGLPEI